MPINLNEWMGDHLWAWWLCALVLVLAAAAITARLRVLAVAAGPAAAAVTAWIRPPQFLLQAWIGVGVSVLACILIMRIGDRRVRDGAPPRRAA